jgi:hypothetical protein
MISKRQCLRQCALTAGFLGLFVGSAALAATITINSLADPGEAGVCALRDAITAANTMTATNGCAAGSGDDTINFLPRITGTIVLASTLPEVTDSLLTISGPAAPGITIDGGFNTSGGLPQGVQVMQVAAGAILNLNQLTIADGVNFTGPGGGIQNYGTLTVANSVFFHNVIASGIVNEETGTLTVTNSTFSHNTAIVGGAIDNFGKLTVTNSTLSDNGANEEGGAISNSGTLTVTNTTFSGNVTFNGPYPGHGGGIQNSGTLTVTNSSFSANSGGPAGIENDFKANIKGTILATNDGGNCSGTIIDAGYNISDDSTCGFGKTGSANNGDGVNPLLSAAGLANNGGPTQTIALQSGSPAIDAIPVADCTDQASPPNLITDDQRGFPRPDAGERVCDIGAYESESFAGQPGVRSCQSTSVAVLTEQFSSLDAAASALGFSNVNALQSAIQAFCKG